MNPKFRYSRYLAPARFLASACHCIAGTSATAIGAVAILLYYLLYYKYHNHSAGKQFASERLMLLMAIQPTSDTPIYLQLRDQVVGALVRGELAEGDTLPSVRQLARDLGINLHTVNKAYQVLASEGYLHLQGRRGARITKRPLYTTDYLERLTSQLSRIWIEAQSHGVDATLFMQGVNRAMSQGATKGNPASAANANTTSADASTANANASAKATANAGTPATASTANASTASPNTANVASPNTNTASASTTEKEV